MVTSIRGETVTIKDYSEEGDGTDAFALHVLPNSKIILNGKPAASAKVRKDDFVMSFKKDEQNGLIAIDLVRPYDESRIGTIEYSSGTVLRVDKWTMTVFEAVGNQKEYVTYQIKPETETWRRYAKPVRISPADLKQKEFVTIKRRFFYPQPEALLIMAWADEKK